MTPVLRSRPVQRRPLALALIIAATALLAGCGSDAPPPPPLLLSGPDTNIVVTIPAGWHQVINSSSPTIPEMVTPTTCMGNKEPSCADGLIRIATTTAANPADAAHAVTQAVTGEAGVKAGPVSADGPARVGPRDGYRQKFTFLNQRGVQNAEVAVVASGPPTPVAPGQREYSVILAWIAAESKTAPVPSQQSVDQVIDSVLVHGGEAPR